MHALRTTAATVEPPLRRVQMDTLRLRLLKVAALVVTTVRRVVVRLPRAFPLAAAFTAIARPEYQPGKQVSKYTTPEASVDAKGWQCLLLQNRVVEIEPAREPIENLTVERTWQRIRAHELDHVVQIARPIRRSQSAAAAPTFPTTPPL